MSLPPEIVQTIIARNMEFMVDSTLNIPYARKVLEHLRAHPEEHDQSQWSVRSACGTTACIAGTALLMDPDTEVSWHYFGTLDMDNVRVNGEPGHNGEVRAAELLGLGMYTGLFYVQDNETALTLLEGYIQAAERYQHATG